MTRLQQVKRFFLLNIFYICLFFAIIFLWSDQYLWIMLFQRSKNPISLAFKTKNDNSNLTQGNNLRNAEGNVSQGIHYTRLKDLGLAKEKLENNIIITSCQNYQPPLKKAKRKTKKKAKRKATRPKEKRLREPCQKIFSDFHKYLEDLETLDREADHSFSKSKQPLPNFFLSSFTNYTTVETYRRANVGFVHLPKSGGTSIETYLFKFMNNDWKKHGVHHCSNFKQAICSANVNLTQHFFFSKRTYGLHSFLTSERPFLYFTWFRDPVSRVVSTYYYLSKIRPKSHQYSNKYIEPSKSLTSFLQQSKTVQYPDFDNFNVRLLQFGDDHTLDENFEDCCGTNLKEIPAVNETHYKTAKKNLENMALIGNMDDWRTSQEMLDLMFDFKTDVKETHVNSNSHKLELTNYERGEIERRNKWDILLHADAMEIYVKQKKAYLLYKAGFEKQM